VSRSPHDLPILAAVLAGVLAFAACDEAPAPEPAAPAIDGELPCSLPCAPGFACVDGGCVPACQPRCPAGTRCTEDGRCEAEAAIGGNPRNLCGGITPLDVEPGAPCGPCGDGRWLCATDDTLACVDPVGTNACGGCGSLPAIPGDACDGGVLGCDEDSTLACVDRVNACGGVAVLEAPPGRPCGTCNAGTFACDTPNSVRCRPPDTQPEDCTCDPEATPWLACGTDAGACERGVRPCLADGTVGPCVGLPVGDACATDADCSQGFCLAERIGPAESLEDGCVGGDEPDCERRRCRTIPDATTCASSDDCRSTEACAGGRCLPIVAPPTDERCNGIDDDCDGRIDNDDRRFDICGVCPFNTLLITNAERDFGRRRICMDVTEASRPDATDTSAGTVETHAQPVFGVVPWTGVTPEQALDACAGTAYNDQIPGGVVERRLCIVDEWQLGCSAPETTYPYGTEHIAGACNDATLQTEGPWPTGSLPECTFIQPRGRFAHWDLVGNVAEWTRAADAMVLSGGHFASSPTAATCAATNPADAANTLPAEAIGFRCCAAPLVGNL
jgi:hypothetical protein